MSIALKSDSGVPSVAPLRARQLVVLLCILVSAVAASFLILKAAPVPFFWLWLTWAAALFAAIFAVDGDWLRAILLTLGILAILMATAEGYLSVHEYTAPVYPDGGYFLPDDVLGWAPAKVMKAHAVKPKPPGLFHHSDGYLFDVTYTIDANGLRVAPPYRKDDVAGTALFFGCSFAFGEGLKDDETVPYQVGMQSEGRYRTFNFSFHAYGPNQMLAAIEHGNVARAVNTTPQYAFYIAIPGHVWRAAGRVGWGGNSPRYVLDANGTVHQSGNFGDSKPLAKRLGIHRGVRQLKKSAIWRALESSDSQITDGDIRLYFAVVRRSQELLTAEYPGIQFRVILWPNQDVPQERATYEKLRDGFRQMRIPVDLVEDIIPGYNTDRSRFILSSVDHHPNALADRLLAQYIVSKILRQTSAIP
jgi:hypothetical protein